MLLPMLLLPLLVTGADYAEAPKGGDGGGVPPTDPHGGPPEKPTGESKPTAGGYAEGPAKHDEGTKPSVGKGGIKKLAPVSEPSAGYIPPVGPKKPDDGPKKNDAYAEAPAETHQAHPDSGHAQGPKVQSGGIKPRTKWGDSWKHPDAGYVEGPHQTEKAHRVQDQAPFCPANAFFNTCPPPRNCEPSCQNYYPSCVWNRCYRPRCTCYQGYYRRSGAFNAPCVQWQQCWRWGGPRGVRPRPPRPGRFDGRTPWAWWLAAILG